MLGNLHVHGVYETRETPQMAILLGKLMMNYLIFGVPYFQTNPYG